MLKFQNGIEDIKVISCQEQNKFVKFQSERRLIILTIKPKYTKKEIEEAEKILEENKEEIDKIIKFFQKRNKKKEKYKSGFRNKLNK